MYPPATIAFSATAGGDEFQPAVTAETTGTHTVSNRGTVSGRVRVNAGSPTMIGAGNAAGIAMTAGEVLYVADGYACRFSLSPPP